MLWKWFMYSVSDEEDWTVKKVLRAPLNTSAQREKSSLELHKTYLWDIIVPETEIYELKSGDFEVHQKKIEGTPLVLTDLTSDNVRKILELGALMQKEHRVLFDIFWMQWMIQLFNYYFWWTPIKELSDFLLPANAKYLHLMHNFPEGLLREMNEATWNPFVAHNILQDSEGKLHFIDTDYRPLKLICPLNIIGNWITQKALADLKNLESKKEDK